MHVSNAGHVALQEAMDELLTGGASDLFAAIAVEVSAGNVAAEGGSTNEVQTVTIDATGGTFTLTYDGQTTATIAFDASAATVDTRLTALSNIGPSDVAVTGEAGGPWAVEFTGDLAEENVALMTGDGASLTGGSTTVVIDPTTGGQDGVLEDVLRTAGLTSVDYTTLQARSHLNPGELPIMFALAAAAGLEIVFTPT